MDRKTVINSSSTDCLGALWQTTAWLKIVTKVQGSTSMGLNQQFNFLKENYNDSKVYLLLLG